jgi:hypothetical protein
VNYEDVSLAPSSLAGLFTFLPNSKNRVDSIFPPHLPKIERKRLLSFQLQLLPFFDIVATSSPAARESQSNVNAHHASCHTISVLGLELKDVAL